MPQNLLVTQKGLISRNLARDITLNMYFFSGTSSWFRNIILVSKDKTSLRINKDVLKKWLKLKKIASSLIFRT